ncbi:MAG: RNA polymerase sigma-32 factor [Methyloprofundus sp.]|nr:MAG: RNA polymerase sigma-32 factor [Methyloprofundus sp.]
MSNSLALPITLTAENFDSYLNIVGQTNKLNAEQERALARLYRDEEDLDAAKQLVMANLRFVAHVARGYNGYGLPMNDIVQEGNIGLMKAVKRFNPDLNIRLVSFAVHWIRAEIHEYVIKNWRIVKVATTKSQRKIFFNLRKSKKNIGWLSKDEAEAIAENLNVDLKTVYEMETRLDGKDMAFDLPESDSNEESFSAPVSYLEQHNADPALMLENADWKEHKESLLSNAIQDLDERSQDIVTSRWLTEKKMTLHELAERYNVSAERIRQLEKNAMRKLKGAVSIAA